MYPRGVTATQVFFSAWQSHIGVLPHHESEASPHARGTSGVSFCTAIYLIIIPRFLFKTIPQTNPRSN